MFKTKQAGLVAIVVILTPGLARSGNELPFLGSECKPYLADRVSRRIVVNLCEDCSDPGSREALISSDLNLGRSVGIVKARSFFLTGKSNGFAPTAAHSETRPATGEGLAQVSDEIQKDYFGAPELDAEGKPTGNVALLSRGNPLNTRLMSFDPEKAPRRGYLTKH